MLSRDSKNKRWIYFLAVVLVISALVEAVNFYVKRSDNCEGVQLKQRCYIADFAKDKESRAKGLSGRDGLPENGAMVFVFDSLDRQCIWMKGMHFPIDILWLNDSKKIIKIEANVLPATYPKTFCADMTKYVIELSAGSSSKAGLNIGDSVQL